MSDSTRPPNQPPTPPPPPRPKPPAPPADRMSAAVADIRSAVARIESPARRDLPQEVAPTGGPVQPPSSVGEEPAPGSAAAISSAARASTGAVVAPGAGASFAVGSAGYGFTLPQPSGPPRFVEGERRLYGLVRR